MFSFAYFFYGLISSTIAIQINQDQRILLGSFQTFPILNNTCSEIIIPNHYKKINITIDSNNISNIIVTDTKIKSCNKPIENFNECCAENSSFCMENINPTHNYMNLYYCLEHTYLYACTGNSTNSLITITTKVINEEGCHFAEFMDETECANVGIEVCKNPNTCNTKCQYVNCLTNQEKEIFSMCLPINYTMTKIVSRCENHIEFNSEGKGGKVSIHKCDRELEETKVTSFTHKIFKGIAVIFGTSLLALVMASVYYRFKTSMDVNTPPFDPPWFCPNFIFPRINPNKL